MRNKLINTIYFIVIFSFAFLVGSISLARKINREKVVNRQLILSVTKQKIGVTNPQQGKVEQVLIRPGDKVEEGQLLIKLSDDIYKSRLDALEELGENNLSAQTEAELLKLDSSSFEINAPRSGIIQEVKVSEGAYVAAATSLATIYADEDTELSTTIDSGMLGAIQKIQKVEGLNQRMGLSFPLVYQGVEKVSEQNSQGVFYKARFAFENPSDGEAFLDNETLEVVSLQREIAKKPTEVIADVWNKITNNTISF